MSLIQRIRQKIIDRNYYLSSHVEAEMMEDELDREDIENAVLKGRVEKRLTHDRRGTRYRIKGPSRDGRLVYVVCRFREESSIIITVYTVTEEI